MVVAEKVQASDLLIQGQTGHQRAFIGVEVGKQQTDAHQVDHTTVRLEKFRLADPGIAAVVQPAQDFRHVGQLVAVLVFFAAQLGLIQQREKTTTARGMDRG
ncbi:hypothetical protein D3C80_1306560 [compost metagenome]